ncbi:MAG: hypothetical protein L0I88_06960 [Alkalibacterium sp.]|nr:hypothetical protein [Alkalibacterium sp.]
MNRKVKYGLGGGIILSLIGLVVGLFIGMNLGGNYFTSFEFMSSRGYEAVGYLAAIVGAVIGMLLGFWLGMKYSNKKIKED